MKTRNGFVSNSSSSSFVVIDNDSSKLMEFIPEYLLEEEPFYYPVNRDKRYCLTIPITSSQMEFGWEFEKYKELGDKLNYAYAQILGLKDNDLKSDYKDMMKAVLRKHMIDNKYLFVYIDYNYFYLDSIHNKTSLNGDQCCVDHQSSYSELGEGYHEIFENEDVLESFLFNTGSFIQCGNDNEDPPESYLKAKILATLYKNLRGHSGVKNEEKCR